MPSSRQRTGRGKPDATFLDANILMYAAGGPHPLREPCQAALESAVRLRMSLVTDSEVLQEILYRYFSIQEPDTARRVHSAATRLCDEVLPVAATHTARALDLLLQYPRLSVRDAVHIATMEDRGLRRILSTDRDFDGVESIRRIDPVHFPS